MTGQLRAGQRPGWRQAAAASIGCSALFVTAYGATQVLAVQRAAELPTWSLPWEASIPLVPWMIVPYVSIDLLFVLAPFLASSAREVRVFVLRVSAAILISSAWFVCSPLQLGFAREPVAGPFAGWFAALHRLDPPHNLFPSLHVALALVLRWTYHRHLRGLGRWLLHGWLILVSLSTLATHQHHVVDVAGGCVLGVFAVYLFPTGSIAHDDPRVARAPSRAWGAAYGALAVALGVLASTVESRWVAVLSGWSALSLVLVAAGYTMAGPRVFRKYSGYLSYPARLLLAPYLLGLRLSRWWFWRRDRQRFATVGDGVFFGRMPDRALAAELRELGVRGVLDLTAEHSACVSVRESSYLCLPIMDLTTPERDVLDAAVAAIETMRRSGGVYVHCALGFGRCRSIVAWWLWRTGRAVDLASALGAVDAVRPRPRTVLGAA